MKTAFQILGVALAFAWLTGCNEDEVARLKRQRQVTVVFPPLNEPAPAREYMVGSEVFWTVTIEGHRYVTRYAGGFTHLESCPCKTIKP